MAGGCHGNEMVLNALRGPAANGRARLRLWAVRRPRPLCALTLRQTFGLAAWCELFGATARGVDRFVLAQCACPPRPVCACGPHLASTTGDALFARPGSGASRAPGSGCHRWLALSLRGHSVAKLAYVYNPIAGQFAPPLPSQGDLGFFKRNHWPVSATGSASLRSSQTSIHLSTTSLDRILEKNWSICKETTQLFTGLLRCFLKCGTKLFSCILSLVIDFSI
jgi:hypothetical protein